MKQVLDSIFKCRLPKLRRNLEECDNHPEFELWHRNLSENFNKLQLFISNINFQECNDNTNVIASLLILHYELKSEGQWHFDKANECVQFLNHQFDLSCGISLDKLLLFGSNNIFNTQKVFDKVLELLHQQLTAEDFKKYPALIEVYFMIIIKIKDYELIFKPTTLLPISLLLIDDYLDENKVKGLQCCSSILECLKLEHFQEGNYYEVIYRVLKKLITEKAVKVTDLVLGCLIHLFNIMPSDAKMTTIDDTLNIVLQQLYIESNLYKKKALFCFANKLIPMHGIHCIKRGMFFTVICDNLDVCSNDSVAEILLEDVLECLQNWMRYCWCVWKLQSNKKLLSVLIKLFYIYCEDENRSLRLHNILLTLFKLCTLEEQKQIQNYLDNQIKAKSFKECFVQKLSKLY